MAGCLEGFLHLMKHNSNKDENWNQYEMELKGRPKGQLPSAPTYEGRQDIAGIMGHMVPIGSGYNMQKHFSKSFRSLGTRPEISSPALG